MKIRANSTGRIHDVHGVYWDHAEGNSTRNYYVIPDIGYPGFISINDSDCDVLEIEVSNFVLLKNSSGKDMLIRDVLIEDGLLDRIIDHDPDAMSYFLARV